MPPRSYCDRDLFSLEKDRIFRQGWVCVGRSSELQDSGDYITRVISDQPLILLKDGTKKLRVMSNVCRHRHALLVEGCGNISRIICPYHAWTYNLDGNLVKAKYMDKTECFEKNHLKLPELKTEIFLGWIYVTLNQNPESLSENLKSLQTMVTPYKMENYINIISEEHEWNTNWKILTENFMEGYHLPVAHQGTIGPYFNVMDTEFDSKGSYDFFTYQTFTKNEDAIVGTAHPSNKSLTGKWRHTSILPTIFPSHMFSLAPDHLWYLSLQPNGTDKVKIKFGAAIAPEVLEAQDNPEVFLEETKRILYEVQNEDRFVVEGICKGVNSPLGSPGPLSWLERENHEFTQYIAKKLTN